MKLIYKLGVNVLAESKIPPINADRRHFDFLTMLQTFVFPAIIAALSAYMSVSITISTLALDVEYLKRDMSLQTKTLAQVTDNQLTLTEVMASIRLQDREKERLNAEIQRLKDRLRVLENKK